MSKKIRPSQVFPELTEQLAKISKTSYELYQLTKPEEIGRLLGVKKQSIQQRIDKQKGKKV